MSSPLVSVCIPCHNAGPYLKEALDSVLDQTYRKLEVILVNDASTDDTSEVLETFKDPRLRVIDHECGSASKSRNLAYEHSTGSLIKFFDADDILSLGLIERQIARLGDSQNSVASCEWGRFQKKNLASYQPNPQIVWRDIDARDWLIESYRDARPMMQPGIFLIPRPLIEKVGRWDERVSPIDDFEFFSRLLAAAEKVKFCKGETVYYRSGLESSLSGKKSRDAIEGFLTSLESGIKALLAVKDTPQAKLACANLLQDFIHTQYPDHPDLRERAATKVRDLGGAKIAPDGPPRFQSLRRILGWKLARRIQRLAGR